MMARGLCRAAAVLLVATAWGRAWPVCLALWGWGDLVFRCTWPYISRCLGNHENPHLSLFGELRTPLHLMLWGQSTDFRRWCAPILDNSSKNAVHNHILSATILFTVILRRQLLRSNRLLMSFLFTIILRSATLGRRSYWKQPNLARSLTFF